MSSTKLCEACRGYCGVHIPADSTNVAGYRDRGRFAPCERCMGLGFFFPNELHVERFVPRIVVTDTWTGRGNASANTLKVMRECGERLERERQEEMLGEERSARAAAAAQALLDQLKRAMRQLPEVLELELASREAAEVAPVLRSSIETMLASLSEPDGVVDGFEHTEASDWQVGRAADHAGSHQPESIRY